MKDPGVVIVGGGLAAQRCAETLRRDGYEAPLRIVCGEEEAPYDRPPLSKGVLAGALPEGSTAFRDRGWYAEQGVELLLGTRAEALDPVAREVFLDSGEVLPYGKLLVASGGQPRRLPFLEGYANVHYLRTLADARRLHAELGQGVRLAIVGAGFIGQEVAATALSLGAEVTMVEALESPLSPILGAELGGWFARLHREQGVRLLTAAMLEGALPRSSVVPLSPRRRQRNHGTESGSRVEELLLAGGERVACDAVVVGVGTAPATAWLRGSGLGETGVEVDAGGRTALPGVFAAGDAAIPHDPRFGGHARTEHWDAAAWQGRAAARAMLGQEPGTPPLPSFWSDQYGLRVRCVGHPHHADEVVLEGDPGGRDFEAVFLRRGAPVAGLAVGRPRAIPAFRKRIEAAHRPDLKEEVVA